MTLRRRTPLRARHQYVPPRPKDPIPRAVRIYVHARDGGCVGRKVNLPTGCWGGLEIDHVRASGGMGMKSASTADNLVTLCALCHWYKTDHGREVRPLLLDYLARVES